MRVYKYCFYRIAEMWKKIGFADDYGYTSEEGMDSVFLSSIAIVSLIQISNVNTLLIIPVLLLQKQLSADLLACIVFAIAICNVFFVNKKRLYSECNDRWKDETKVSKTRNKRAVIIFIIISVVMMLVSFKIVYAPHSLTFPLWGN